MADAEAAPRSSEAALEAAHLRLERTEIRAPIAGVVTRRYAGPGRPRSASVLRYLFLRAPRAGRRPWGDHPAASRGS